MGAAARCRKAQRTSSSRGVVVLLLGAMSLVALKFVRVKMLPFDNKSEFQVVVDMPEGTTLEQTDRGQRSEIAELRARRMPEVVELPDVRRHGGAVQLQRPRAALLPAARVERGRHAGEPRREGRAQGARATTSPSASAPPIAPIASRIRRAHQGRRGPARAAGAPDARRRDLRPELRARRSRSRGRCAASSRATRRRRRRRLVRRGRPGEVPLRRRRGEGGAERRQPGEQIAPTSAPRGAPARAPASCTTVREKEDVPIVLRLDRAARARTSSACKRYGSRAATATSCRSASSCASSAIVEDKSIYHKNLMPVVYVTGDVAGAKRARSTRS